MERRYDIVTPEEVDEGEATDAYFERTEEILDGEGLNPSVVADVGEEVGTPHVFAGLKDAARLLEGTGVDLYALPEGSVFESAPVMRIEGPYRGFGR